MEEAHYDEIPKAPITEIFENFHLVDPEEERK